MSDGNRAYPPPNARNRRPLYARPPPPPPSRGSRQHSALGYWLPLIVTGTIAVGGLAAWVWATRGDDDDDDHYPHDYKPQQPGQSGSVPPFQGPPPSQSAGPQGGPPPVNGQGASASYYNTQTRETTKTTTEEDNSFYGQVRGVIRRTPSPEQFFSHVSKQASAGMAAAGAALSSIVEEGPGRRQQESREDREGFSDHERWSEEADDLRRVNIVDAESERRAEAARMGREDTATGRTKRTVAVVVSADANMDGTMDEDDVGYMNEHASVLSHLPTEHSSENTHLIILIYAPGMDALPPLNYRPSLSGRQTPPSPNTPALTPGTEIAEPSTFPSPGASFDALWIQALSLVSSPSHILPFTTLEGYVHVLRHLAPQTVYVPDSLAGDAGSSVARLSGWVGHTVLVVGDEATGGLADTETEDEGPDAGEKKKWYETSSLVGLGKAVEIVDISRVGDDWARRITSQS